MTATCTDALHLIWGYSYSVRLAKLRQSDFRLRPTPGQRGSSDSAADKGSLMPED